MAHTPDQINQFVNEIVNEYTGKSISYYGTYQNQCTVPVAYYVEKVIGAHAPSMANARADGWGTNFPAQLAPHFTHEAYQMGKHYPRGTIVMWNSPPESHIAIVLSSDGSNNLQVFEQNADPNGAPCKSTSRVVNNQFHTATYALVPITSVAPPAPAPTPVLPQQNITGKQLFLPATAGPWRVYRTTGPYLVGHEVGKLMPQNYPPGLTYDIQGNPAANVFIISTQSYGQVAIYAGSDTPAQFHAIPAPAPAYVPPAAPLPVPKAPQYTLVTTVMAFKNASDAANHNNAQRTLKAGTYYVFNDPTAEKQYGMYNLTARADKPGDLDGGTGGWINPRDNVVPEPVKVEVVPTPPAPTPAPTPPAPTPETAPAPVEPAKPQVSQVTTVKDPNFWKTTNVAVNATRQPEVFYPRFEEDIVIHDLEGRLGDITFHPYQIKDGLRELVPVPIISTFWKDGVEYGRTPKAAQIGAWYGFPMSYFDYGSTTTAAERFSLGTAKFRDYIDKWAGDADRLIRDINVKIKERKAKK